MKPDYQDEWNDWIQGKRPGWAGGMSIFVHPQFGWFIPFGYSDQSVRQCRYTLGLLQERTVFNLVMRQDVSGLWGICSEDEHGE